MKNKHLEVGLSILSLIGALFVTQSAFLFLEYCQPIIKAYTLISSLMYLACAGLLIYPLITIYKIIKGQREISYTNRDILKYAVIGILGFSFIVYAILESALFDFFQPFSARDKQIYAFIYGVLALLVKFIIDLVRMIVTKKSQSNVLVSMICVIALIFTLIGYDITQSHYEYENGVYEEVHLFDRADGKYASYRIPTILVIPKGSKLGSGEVLVDDLLLTFAEARKNSSNDNGDIDLVMRRSIDSGMTWQDQVVVVDMGDNKIGNLTPVFDQETGVIHMMHLLKFYDGSQASGAYMMTSDDGGLSWTDSELILENGGIGPGHGTQIKGGDYDGRLLIPGYNSKAGFVYYSDDNGQTWIQSEPTSMGNETEVAQLDEDTILMTTRVNVGMALEHGEEFKHFAYSYDGGETWTDAKANMDVITPICMSGLDTYKGTVYYSGPQLHFTRANMHLLKSTDKAETFDVVYRIYEGPSGYSDLGVLSNGQIAVLFENGAVEYDERLTIMIFED